VANSSTSFKVKGIDLADITFLREKAFSPEAILKNPALANATSMSFSYNGNIINVKSIDPVADYLKNRRSELFSVTLLERAYTKTLKKENGEEEVSNHIGYDITGFLPIKDAVGYLTGELQTVELTAKIEAIKTGAFKPVENVSAQTASVLEGMATE
jgi:hypothetical protein